MRETFLFNLGDVVKHAISGFAGKVTGRAEYMSGNVQYLLTVQGRTNANTGLPIEDWFSEKLLEAVESGI